MGATIALLAWTEKAQAALLSFDAKSCKATRTAVFPSPLPDAEPEEGRIIEIKEQVVLSLSDSSAYAVETWGSAVTAFLDPQGKKTIIIRGDKPRLDMQRDRLYAAQGNSVVEYDWTGIWTTAMGSR